MEGSAPAYDRWFEEGQVIGLTKELGDPPSFAALRRTAFEAYLQVPVEPDPLYRKYAYFRGTDLTGLSPVSGGPAVGLPPVPAQTIRVVHDGSGTRVEFPEDLRAAGVQVRTLPSGEPELPLDASDQQLRSATVAQLRDLDARRRNPSGQKFIAVTNGSAQQLMMPKHEFAPMPAEITRHELINCSRGKLEKYRQRYGNDAITARLQNRG